MFERSGGEMVKERLKTSGKIAYMCTADDWIEEEETLLLVLARCMIL